MVDSVNIVSVTLEELMHDGDVSKLPDCVYHEKFADKVLRLSELAISGPSKKQINVCDMLANMEVNIKDTSVSEHFCIVFGAKRILLNFHALEKLGLEVV